MLGRLLKTVFGEANAETVMDVVAPARDPLRELLSFSDLALRQLFVARYQSGQEDWAEVNRITAASHDAAFAGDPLPPVLALLEMAPRWVAWRRRQPTVPERARLDSAVTGTLAVGLDRALARHGDRLPIGPAQLARVLDATARLVALGDYGRHGGVGWLDPLVREAAARGDVASRAALIATFATLLSGEPRDRDSAVVRAEALLPLSGLRRDEVPVLVAIDRRAGELDAVRARAFAELGAPLGEALRAVLDHEPLALNASLAEAVKHPALRALADLSPADKGAAFHHLLGWLRRNEARFGAAGWNEVQKRRDRYTTAIVPPDMPHQVGNLLGVLASRKIELVDPDGDIATFLGLLHHFPLLGYKKIVELVLEAVRAHPHGRAAPALRAAIAPGNNVHALRDHKLLIEEMLRSLPTTATHPMTGAPAGPVGFGRKGVATDPAPQGLPPIPLPDIDLDRWNGSEQLGQHFDNIFDSRLHNTAHQDYLARLAALAEDVRAIGDGQPATPEARARLRAFGLADYADGRRQAHNLARAVEPASDLQARYAALAPFVAAHAEVARVLGRLAAELDGKAQLTGKWLAEGKALMAAVPADMRLEMVRALLSTPTPVGYCPVNQDQIRALLFLSADLDPAVLGPLLTDYALKRCYVTLPGIGIRNEKLGNACLWTLAALPQGSGVPYLARILARTKYPKIKARVDAKLNEAAAKAGIDRATLDELTVPTHDLDRDGRCVMPVGDGTATLRVVDGRSVAIDWAGPGEKPLKAPSVTMKADGEALKAARAAAKELEADLAVQPQRLQRVYLEHRSWPAATWRERYLDHPLLRALASRLVWWVERDGARVAAMPDGEAMADATGAPIAIDGASIRLWHPVDAGAAEIEAWRDRLEALALMQPFAQVWREVYALTDAERATGTYSNRWAAHLLKQHQAMTLARINGWRVTHRVAFDTPNDQPWHLRIAAHGLVADYWVEGTGGDAPETAESGAYLYVATDRVQFHGTTGDDGARGRAVPLVVIPPIVFSEVMRHADLFTAVASIAADPNWLDRGGDAAHPNQWGRDAAAYWKRTNAGELEESGKRRHAMLARIVPRLKIAARLTLEDRHLVVEGSRHRYRIHLGSGASFRGERHICIVPAGEPATGKLWLPFEGDRTLSIILSKAALLANDAAISDPVILAQL